MSTKGIVNRLSEPVRSLVLSATKDAGSSVFGASEKDEAEVQEWIEKASNPSVVDASGIKVCKIRILCLIF